MFLSILPFLIAVVGLTLAAIFRYVPLGPRGRRRLTFVVSHLLHANDEEGWRVARIYLVGAMLFASLGIVAVSVGNSLGVFTDTGPIGRVELLGLLLNMFNLVFYIVTSGVTLFLLLAKHSGPVPSDGGLILARRSGESLRLSIAPGVDSGELFRRLRDDGILISIGEIHGNEIKVGIVAPRGIRVLRDEVAAGTVG
ncbi:carbon storage regulator [Pseudomonas sp. LRF_L74]|uniref:carbon storage regulator n=1 Tax=Pseudomonas sp. LRF_L74 TaxID=3369422 RepID=UPI003F5EAC6F